ncbi:right-handed parallel beta-helix repeat-containing protein [Dyadobacter sp. CY327]|uniref:right-handed parallel beta-helix repeat-containing protein n=1 Tax=Dyadobacter sp. CY327 TaxID=2907301 RepID=UPI001F46260F|nr:right-handed parallel beta-helix repeat-containing protein [Dyadobacter sp. CY327]MCE7071018.1 right-handed parallel beta-helix repeat-containing protein [Dyadobacter sp. CY327]
MRQRTLHPIATTFLWLILATTTALAQKIYVDVNGSDSNTGDLKSPVASIHKAAEIAREISAKNAKGPIKILIGKGHYPLARPLGITAGVNDFNNVPVIFKGNAAAKPVFIGGYEIKGFVKISEKLWKVHVPQAAAPGTQFEQLYINGKRSQRAKSPNDGFYHPLAVSEDIIKQGTGRVAEEAVQKIKLAPDIFELLTKTSSEEREGILLKFYHFWDNTFKPFINLNPADCTVSIHGKGMQMWNKITEKSFLEIENAMAFLDEPGEWYLNKKGDLYYFPREGEIINDVKCIAPLTNQFITLKGSTKARLKNISFENIEFRTSNYNLPGGIFDPTQAAYRAGAAIEIDSASNINIKNCRISQTGANAIWFRRACRDSRVSHCYLHDLGAGAVKIGETETRKDDNDLTKNIRVDNNIIRSGGRVLPCAVAVIIFKASENIVTHNEISDFYYTGISVGWVWGYASSPSKGNKILYNHIHNLGQEVLSDMGGIYTLGASEETVISNNVIHDISAHEYGAWGIYCDQGSSFIEIENNLVYKCGSAGFHQHFGKDNVVRNNIFALNGQGELQLTRVEKHRSLLFTNNIVYSEKPEIFLSNWSAADIKADSNAYWTANKVQPKFARQNFSEWQAKSKDLHSKLLNPAFVNAMAGNFRITNLSTAKQIKFKPFDYRSAGVYGDAAWKALAKSAKAE